MIFEPFKPEHLQALIVQPAQEYARADYQRREYAEALVNGDSYAAVMDGRVVACVGVLPIWQGRGDAWAIIARDIGPKGMHALHYEVRKRLQNVNLRRIEAACDAAFLQAHRWLYLLGFKYEGPLAKYTPDGRDCLRFAMVR